MIPIEDDIFLYDQFLSQIDTIKFSIRGTYHYSYNYGVIRDIFKMFKKYGQDDVDNTFINKIPEEITFYLNKYFFNKKEKIHTYTYLDKINILQDIIINNYGLTNEQLADDLYTFQKIYAQIRFEFDCHVSEPEKSFDYFIKTWASHLYCVLVKSDYDSISYPVREINSVYFKIYTEHLFSKICNQLNPNPIFTTLFLIWLIEFHNVKKGIMEKIFFT